MKDDLYRLAGIINLRFFNALLRTNYRLHTGRAGTAGNAHNGKD